MNDRTFFCQAEDEDFFSQSPHSRLSIDRYPDGSYHLHYACGASRHDYVYRFDEDTWEIWTNDIKKKTGFVGKDLFMPLRLILTGKEKGPELKYLLPLFNKQTILRKFGKV